MALDFGLKGVHVLITGAAVGLIQTFFYFSRAIFIDRSFLRAVSVLKQSKCSANWERG